MTIIKEKKGFVIKNLYECKKAMKKTLTNLVVFSMGSRPQADRTAAIGLRTEQRGKDDMARRPAASRAAEEIPEAGDAQAGKPGRREKGKAGNRVG